MSLLGNELWQGELVYLQPFTEKYLEAANRWFGENIGMIRNLTLSAVHPHTPDEQEDFARRSQESSENGQNFAIIRQSDDEHIGGCSLFAFSRASQSAMLGIHIGDSDNWSKGYGSNAMRVLLKIGFMELNLHRIGLMTWSFNTRAQRSYEKVGFTYEGQIRQAMIRDGQAFDIVCMSVLRREWIQQQDEQSRAS